MKFSENEWGSFGFYLNLLRTWVNQSTFRNVPSSFHRALLLSHAGDLIKVGRPSEVSVSAAGEWLWLWLRRMSVSVRESRVAGGWTRDTWTFLPPVSSLLGQWSLVSVTSVSWSEPGTGDWSPTPGNIIGIQHSLASHLYSAGNWKIYHISTLRLYFQLLSLHSNNLIKFHLPTKGVKLVLNYHGREASQQINLSHTQLQFSCQSCHNV